MKLKLLYMNINYTAYDNTQARSRTQEVATIRRVDVALYQQSPSQTIPYSPRVEFEFNF